LGRSAIGKKIIVISFYNIPTCTIVNSNKGVTALVQDARSWP